VTDTAIVVTVFNRMEAVSTCLMALSVCVDKKTPVVVVDDGSTDGARDVVRSFSGRFRTILNKENSGLCAASNIGFDEARRLGATNVIRMNSDIKMLPGCLDHLRAAVRPGIGIVGPTYASEKYVFTDQRYPQPKDKRVDIVSGHCMLISGAMLGVGFRWDENLHPMGPCDADASCFSTAHGLSNVIARNAVCLILECAPSANWIDRKNYLKRFGEGKTYVSEKWKIPDLFGRPK